MSIETNYLHLKENLSSHVTLAAVSKTHGLDKIQQIYDLGQRIFAENKVQELLEKQPQLPKDIEWHLIGHLQSNKVKQIASFIHTIQSVDSEKLLRLISQEAQKNEREINVLLQVKIASEESKFGLEINEAKILFQKYQAGEFPHVKLQGLMGMATLTDEREIIAKEFATLKALFDEFSSQTELSTLSMGMTSDYQIAIDEGSNLVRIGSLIFGNRQYPL